MGFQRFVIQMISIEEVQSHSDPVLQKYWNRAKEDLSSVKIQVESILERVETSGDKELKKLTKEIDHLELDNFIIQVSSLDYTIPKNLEAALEKAHETISQFHEFTKPQGKETTIQGNRLGYFYSPVESVALYSPGGTALYPSSILMAAIPAKIAGVKGLVLVTPPRKEGIPGIILHACKLVGIETIVTLGGAQGIGAVGFGTESIPKVDFIVGPGNKYVASAKSILQGRGLVGIDSPAGPSDVFVIADDSANPDWISADMLSQAEHGSDSSAFLATNSRQLANQVQKAIERDLEARPKRRSMKEAAIANNSAIFLLPNLEECAKLANYFAPEHLEIQTASPNEILKQIKHAGSVFLGPYSPVAMGDYISGTNHILPTAGLARYYSGLGVDTYLKRITYQELSKEGISHLGLFAIDLSIAEGLDEEHGNSIRIRLT